MTCSNWNNTGPTEGDDAIPRGLSCDPDGTWAAKRAAVLATGPEGRCTSIVTQDSGGAVTHGRNLDWNIPEELKEFVIDLDVFQNGTLLFTGTGAVGFVGMLNGMRQREGGGRWTVSQDARNHGGRIPFNLLEALKTGALTPEQALRHALESEGGGFEAAVAALSEVQIVDDEYFIMSGEGPEDAAVVTRDRNQARDVWRLFVDAATTPHAPTPLPPSTNWWLTEVPPCHVFFLFSLSIPLPALVLRHKSKERGWRQLGSCTRYLCFKRFIHLSVADQLRPLEERSRGGQPAGPGEREHGHARLQGGHRPRCHFRGYVHLAHFQPAHHVYVNDAPCFGGVQQHHLVRELALSPAPLQ